MPGLNDETEWQTRKRRIDPRLDAAGWSRRAAPAPAGPSRTEEHPTDNGPADYALHIDGAPVGIVEAKKLSRRPAERPDPSRALRPGPCHQPTFDFGGLRVPFLYSTNGEVIWFHDVRAPAEPLARGRGVPHAGGAARAARPRLRRRLRAPSPTCRTTTRGSGPTRREANAAVEQAIADRQAPDAGRHGHRHGQDVHDW